MNKIYLLLLPALLICSAASAQVVGQNMLENFETVSRFTYPRAIYSGVYDSAAANPSATGVNTSPKVGKYIRNAGVQYDVLACNMIGGTVRDVASYLTGAKKISIKINSTAPVGTEIQLTLQNAQQSTGGYPQGRHSVYVATTTMMNAWETLVFNFNNQPSGGVDANGLDQMIISFKNNSNTGDTYYFDDIAGYDIGAAPRAIINEFLWSDFGSNNFLSFRRADGAVSRVANPAISPSHVAQIVSRYDRSNIQYDVLAYSWGSTLQNLADYKANAKKFSLNVFSPAAGTTVQFTLQDSTAARGNYPAGRYGEFVGATTTTNQWERVVLSFVNTPDGSITDGRVNELAILFNSGVGATATLFVDTLFGPVFVPVANRALINKSLVTLAPNPATDRVQVSATLARSGAIAIEVIDAQGRIVAADKKRSMPAGTVKSSFSILGLEAGIYQCRVSTPDGVSVQRLAIQ